MKNVKSDKVLRLTPHDINDIKVHLNSINAYLKLNLSYIALKKRVSLIPYETRLIWGWQEKYTLFTRKLFLLTYTTT